MMLAALDRPVKRVAVERAQPAHPGGRDAPVAAVMAVPPRSAIGGSVQGVAWQTPT
jgi:hypothetical protein